MENCSYFIKDKGLFGSHPSNEDVTMLEGIGVKVFVDLTYENEKKIVPYTTNCRYISYPIKDNNIPYDRISFTVLIYNLCNILHTLPPGDLLYVHCKGGHGRSGVVVACIVSKFCNFSPKDAILHTTKSHDDRITMRDIWRRMGSPQTKQQKQFVYNMCRTVIITDRHLLSISSDFKVNIEGVVFNNALSAINNLISKGQTDLTAINTVLRERDIQHSHLVKILVDTGLKYIKVNDMQPYSNLVANCLSSLRSEYIIQNVNTG
uniref:Tyrosine specific protein phosphatases domain-containing protein n=1 Tax=viral metagenome TaxID=1070528 RepID=A0A6C0LSZ0_9ZZZZ